MVAVRRCRGSRGGLGGLDACVGGKGFVVENLEEESRSRVVGIRWRGRWKAGWGLWKMW